MTTEKQSSYFLRTQSSILNGENNINIKKNTFRNNKRQLNRNYLSAGNNRKKNRKYISKNSKKTYVGIDLEKVSGSTHIYNNRNKKKKNNINININKIPVKKSLNYYQFLTKKNKKKEEEKNINDINNEKNTRIIYKSNNYSPFHQIIANIKDKKKYSNYIPRNDDNVNKFLISNRFNTNPSRKDINENINENNNNKNAQFFSSYRKCINENNFQKQNDSKFNFTYNNNNNQINNNNNNNNKSLYYLNENVNDNELVARRIKLMNQIKNISKTNNQNIYNKNNQNQNEEKKENIKEKKDLQIKINKSYSSNNYNNTCINNNNINSIYTPLPYKSFLKSIFDQNLTNKYVNDFNKISYNTFLKNKNNNTFDYNKNRTHKKISKGFFEFNEDENKLKKMLENIPRHNKENKKNIFDIIPKNKNDNITKNFLYQINYVMPPNKLINKSNDII